MKNIIFSLFLISTFNVGAKECKDFSGIYNVSNIPPGLTDANGKDVRTLTNAHIELLQNKLVVTKSDGNPNGSNGQELAACEYALKNFTMRPDKTGFKTEAGWEFDKIGNLAGHQNGSIESQQIKTNDKELLEQKKAKKDYDKEIEECKQREIRKVQSVRSSRKLTKAHEKSLNDHITRLDESCDAELDRSFHPYSKASRESERIRIEENRFNKALTKLPINARRLINADKYQSTDLDEITDRLSDESKYSEKYEPRRIRVPADAVGRRGALDIDAERIEGFGAEFEDIELE